MAPRNARKTIRKSQKHKVKGTQKKIANVVQKIISKRHKNTLEKETKRKTKLVKGVKRTFYDTKSIVQAVEAIEGGLSIRDAAALFNVPKSTLHYKKTTGTLLKLKAGPHPALTNDEEDALVNWIFECSRRGFPVRSVDLNHSVQHYLNQNPRPNTFVDNRPGRRWLHSFLSRHPELSTIRNESVSEEAIINWFESVELVMQEEEVLDVLKDPSRIFHAAETGFILGKSNYDPEEDEIVSDPNEKQTQVHFTMVFTFSAVGQFAPPMTVYPEQECLPLDVLSVPSGWGVAQTDKGYMTSAIFYEYIETIFINYLDERNIQRPVVLFVSASKPQITYQMTELCAENQIVLICLYPNASKILLPAYGMAFKPLKDVYKKSILESQANNLRELVSKDVFSLSLEHAFDRCVGQLRIAKGFRQAGLFPWDVASVDLNKVISGVYEIPSPNQEEEEEEQHCRSSPVSHQPTVIHIKTEPIIIKTEY